MTNEKKINYFDTPDYRRENGDFIPDLMGVALEDCKTVTKDMYTLTHALCEMCNGTGEVETTVHVSGGGNIPDGGYWEGSGKFVECEDCDGTGKILKE